MMLPALAIICLVSVADATPVAYSFAEDYLNPIRLGPHSAPPGEWTTLAVGAPLGRTLEVPADISEVYRIRVRVGQEDADWQSDERLTLRLWDAPERRTLLGEYTRGVGDRNASGDAHAAPWLMFPLRARVAGGGNLLFELIHEGGGDGKLPVQLAAEPGGGIWFETHVKPRRTRDEVFGALFAKVDLGLAELEDVRQAVERRDWDAAMAAYVAMYERRSDEIRDEWVGKPDRPGPHPDFDRSVADLWLEGDLVGEGGERATWRPESNWTPRTSFQPEWSHSQLNGFFILRALGYAYWSTGDERFVRKALALRRQFLLDNPNPHVSDIQLDHQTWNELAAVHRAPGHGVYAYGRFMFSPEFPLEDRFVWFVSFYENAAYLSKSNAGGNWGFQTFEGLYSFGLSHPEWKASGGWVGLASAKLIELTLETVRADGTEHEAAIKYHMMCARRLFRFLRDDRDGVITLPDDARGRLLHALEGMYEHGAHLLKPDGDVVMSGDSWLENYSDELADAGRFLDRSDMVWIGTRGAQGTPPEEISKAFPLGGYYIMREHFGAGGRPYADAVQLVVHNGWSIGSHWHGDFTGINLYAGGNTLLVDSGQYDHDTRPPYWWSSQHSLVNIDGRDAKREPRENLWRSTAAVDYFEGSHDGYAPFSVRRRILWLKPAVFLVTDDVTGPAGHQATIDQVWHLGTASADKREEPLRYRTTFETGANLDIVPLLPRGREVVLDKGLHNARGGTAEGVLVKFRRVTSAPLRYVTVLFVDRGDRSLPRIEVVDATGGTVVRVWEGERAWTLVLGQPGETTAAGAGQVAARAAVLEQQGGAVDGLWLLDATAVSWNGERLFASSRPQDWIEIRDEPAAGRTMVRYDDPPGRIAVLPERKRARLFGEQTVERTPEADGFVSLGGDGVVYDDLDPAFERITQTEEWDRRWHGSPYGSTYLVHETDVGRIETGQWNVAAEPGKPVLIEAYWPDSLFPRSNDVRFHVPGRALEAGDHPAAGVVRSVTAVADGMVVTVDQARGARQWNRLGVFEFAAPAVTVRVENHSPDDGRYPMFDAIRLTPLTAP